MSQFILFKSDKKRNISYPLSGNPFLQQKAIELFGSYKDIYTIPDFDAVCVLAQKYQYEIPFTQTKLYQLLHKLSDSEIFIWYGSESDSLEEIYLFKDLVNCVIAELKNYSGEIYLHYSPCMISSRIHAREE